MKAWFVGGLVAMLSLTAAHASAEPRHEGFTGDLGIGAALTLVPRTTVTECFSTVPGACDGVSGETTEIRNEFGLAPLSLSLGGFLSPSVALLGRTASTSYFRGDDQIVHAFYGVVVEYWPVERLFLGGGFGLALFGPNPLLSNSPVEPEAGLGLDVRVGVALAGGTNHDFTLSLEAIPGFYADEVVTGFALVAAWKWY